MEPNGAILNGVNLQAYPNPAYLSQFVLVRRIAINRKTGVRVYRGYYRAVNSPEVVLKIILSDDTDPTCVAQAKSLMGEYKMLKNIQHPNIIQVYDFKQSPFTSPSENITCDSVYLCMEFAENGDLLDFINQIPFYCEDFCRFYIRQIALGVRYMHDNNLAHRDLKPDNVVIDKHLNAKIIDMGFTKRFSSGRMAHGYIGTEYYMAPEILFGQGEYDPMKADVYALGITLFTMFFKTPPLEQKRPENVHQNLIFVNNSQFWQETKMRMLMPTPIPVGMIELINAMLKYDFRQRCTLADVLASPWLNQPSNIQMVRNEISLKINTSRNPRAQPEATDGSNDTRGGSAEIDQEFEGVELAFNDCSEGAEVPTILGNCVIYCENIQFLSGLILTKAKHMEFTHEFDEEKELVLTNKDGIKIKVLVEKVAPGPTDGPLAGRFDGKYEVSFMRLEGDVFEYYKLKDQLATSITEICDTIPEEEN